ncbi:MAG: hypothetical protein AAF366_00785 [Pseudomonadota bacterium]
MTAMGTWSTGRIPRAFWVALGLNAVWINLSEVVRYFAFVMPMMRAAFPMVPDVAPMTLPVFLVWGLWDTILVVSVTAMSWLAVERFGATVTVALAAGSFAWMSIFVILWLGLFNMNLATGPILAVALPLAWLEMAVAALIVRWAVRRG